MLSYEKIKNIIKTLKDKDTFTLYPMELTYFVPKKVLDKINEDIFYKVNKGKKDVEIEYLDVVEVEYSNVKVLIKENKKIK